MSNTIAPGSSANVNVKVTALTTNPNVPVQYKTIILKKNLVNGVNTLIQAMMNQANTKYVIKYDYVLGENITVPAGCILEFDGGSISGNGTGKDTIIVDNTYIKGNGSCLVKLNGNFQYSTIDVFGVKPSNTGSVNSTNIETFLLSISNISVYGEKLNSYLRFGTGIYKFSQPIVLEGIGGVYGDGDTNTQLIFEDSDGIVINNSISGGHKGFTIKDLYIYSSGNAIDLARQGRSLTGGYFSNLTLYTPNGAGIYSTVRGTHVYGCLFESIKFDHCRYCVSNTSLSLNCVFVSCIDFSCGIYFNNCVFDNTEFYGGNVGWGTINHFIYNDISYEGATTDNYRLFIHKCNFEEFQSNIIVCKEPVDNPSKKPIFTIVFDNCHFYYNKSMVGKTIYVQTTNSPYTIEEKVCTTNDEFIPIVGFEINPKFINVQKTMVNDQGDIIYDIPIVAYTISVEAHKLFENVNEIILVRGYIQGSWLRFLYPGKNILYLSELVNNTIRAQYLSLDYVVSTLYILQGKYREITIVNDIFDSNYVLIAFGFSPTQMKKGSNVLFAGKSGLITKMSDYCAYDTDMNSTTITQYLYVGAKWINASDNFKLKIYNGTAWVDAIGT